jgi:hypothetical protein
MNAHLDEVLLIAGPAIDQRADGFADDDLFWCHAVVVLDHVLREARAAARLEVFEMRPPLPRIAALRVIGRRVAGEVLARMRVGVVGEDLAQHVNARGVVEEIVGVDGERHHRQRVTLHRVAEHKVAVRRHWAWPGAGAKGSRAHDGGLVDRAIGREPAVGVLVGGRGSGDHRKEIRVTGAISNREGGRERWRVGGRLGAVEREADVGPSVLGTQEEIEARVVKASGAREQRRGRKRGEAGRGVCRARRGRGEEDEVDAAVRLAAVRVVARNRDARPVIDANAVGAGEEQPFAFRADAEVCVQVGGVGAVLAGGEHD